MTLPATTLSAIAVEAYKKYSLVSLIAYGKVDTLPRYTPPIVSRLVRRHAQPYHNLVTAFAEHSIDEVKQCADANAEAFLAVSFVCFVRGVCESG